ncbi:MAG: hypothetical protein KBT34_03130 [Prevotella sp.]|nr:hypothetical protein [Candidatus Prevotella equi]
MTKNELICVLDVIDLEYDDEYLSRILSEINRRLKTWKTYRQRYDNKII